MLLVPNRSARLQSVRRLFRLEQHVSGKLAERFFALAAYEGASKPGDDAEEPGPGNGAIAALRLVGDVAHLARAPAALGEKLKPVLGLEAKGRVPHEAGEAALAVTITGGLWRIVVGNEKPCPVNLPELAQAHQTVALAAGGSLLVLVAILTFLANYFLNVFSALEAKVRG